MIAVLDYLLILLCNNKQIDVVRATFQFKCRKRGGYEEEKRELAKWNKAERRKVLNSVRGKPHIS